MLKAVIIDDEIIVRIGLMSCIKWEDYGYEVIGAYETAAEAIQSLDKSQPDIVFTDIKMPGMNGLELVEYLHNNYPKIKIVVLSCLNEVDYVKRAMKLGADDYILKLSLTPQILGELLEGMKKSILDIQAAQREKPISFEHNTFEREQAYRMLVSKGTFPEQRKNLLLRLGYRQDREGSYLVCCCLADDFKNASVRSNLSDGYLVKFALLNILHEFLDKYPFAEAISISENECLIIIRFLPKSNISSEIASYVYRLNDALKTHLNLTVSLGVPKSFSEIDQLPAQYEKAQSLAALRFFYGRQAMITEKMANQSGSRQPDKNLPQILQGAIDSQDRERAAQNIGDWFHKIREQREYLLPQAVKTEVVRAWVFVSGYSTPEGDWEEGLEEDDYFSLFWDAETLEQLQRELVGAVLGLIDLIAENKNSHPSIVQFKRYLTEHINENLTLSQAAAICCLSKTYFCTLFKKETGENFTNYFGRLKMEKARQLLLTENIKVYEAANAVGISDMSYFNKLFRKHFGFSPSQVKSKRKSKDDTN